MTVRPAIAGLTVSELVAVTAVPAFRWLLGP